MHNEIQEINIMSFQVSLVNKICWKQCNSQFNVLSCSFVFTSFLETIAILTTASDQSHEPCTFPKTHFLYISLQHYIEDNQHFDRTTLS